MESVAEAINHRLRKGFISAEAFPFPDLNTAAIETDGMLSRILLNKITKIRFANLRDCIGTFVSFGYSPSFF